MNAQDNYNEHLKITGDTSACLMYLPFARKTSKLLLQTAYDLGSYSLTKNFNLGNVQIKVFVAGDQRHISLHGISQVNKSCGRYLSGLVRNCQSVPNVNQLNEYMDKDNMIWQNLNNFNIQPNTSIIELGYPAGKTQHAYIKADMYTGFMRYAIQNLLGTDRQIGFKYGWKETDGILVETIGSLIINGGAYYLQDVLDLRFIKISDKGVFVKKARHCLPFNIELSETNTGVIDNNYGSDYETFVSLLENSSFDIPNSTNLATEVLENYTTTELLSEVAMQEFYGNGKLPLFNSCGWYFPMETIYTNDITSVPKGTRDLNVRLAFNTCHDGVKAYLYCLRINIYRTIYSSTYKLSQEYQDDPQTQYNPNCSYEYSVELLKVHDGDINTIQDKTGIFVPNENLNSMTQFTGTNSNVDIFAPLYVFQLSSPYNYTSGDFEIDIFGTSKISIVHYDEDQYSPLDGSTRFSTDVKNQIKEHDYTVLYMAKSYISSNSQQKLLMTIEPTTTSVLFEDKNRKNIIAVTMFVTVDEFDPTIRYIERYVRISGNAPQEQLVIPFYNRNSVVNYGKFETIELTYVIKETNELTTEIISTDITPYTNATNTEFFQYTQEKLHYGVDRNYGKHKDLKDGLNNDIISGNWTTQLRPWYATTVIESIDNNLPFRVELITDCFSSDNFYKVITDTTSDFKQHTYNGYPLLDNTSYINYIGRPNLIKPYP